MFSCHSSVLNNIEGLQVVGRYGWLTRSLEMNVEER